MATDSALTGVGTSNVLQHAKLERDFNRVLAVHGPALTRLAGAYTNTSGDRDDLIQEIAIAIWQAMPRFRGECSERTFVFRIAHNRAISHLAQRSPRALSEDIEVRDPAPGPEEEALQGQALDRLTRTIRGLPVPYRQVIMLVLEDLSYCEIAEVLGISESTVGARATRARQMLRALWERKR